jgi:hypothetical protein
MEELRIRLKEKIKERFPKADFKDDKEWIDVNFGKKAKARIFLPKLLDELNALNPSKWEREIEKRIPTKELLSEQELQERIISFQPRVYSKEGMPPMDKLEEGGIIVLKDLGDQVAILVAEFEDKYLGVPEKVLIEKYKMTKLQIDEAKEKAKKKLEEMGF